MSEIQGICVVVCVDPLPTIPMPSPRPKNRVLKSIFAVFLVTMGFMMVGLATHVFASNERQMNLADLAAGAIDITGQPQPKVQNNQLISITDRITASAPMGDDLFLTPRNYVVIDRLVEKYEQKDVKDSASKEPVRSEDRGTWTASPGRSTHSTRNSAYKRIPDKRLTAPNPKVGPYSIDLESITTLTANRSSCKSGLSNNRFVQDNGIMNGISLTLPNEGVLTLTPENTQITPGPRFRWQWQSTTERRNQYIFQGVGSPSRPEWDDLRVCYTVLPTQTVVTVFGSLLQNRLVPYLGAGAEIQRIIPGSRQEAIEKLKSEHRTSKWMGRILGFIPMWFGLGLICSPGILLPGQIPGLRWMDQMHIFSCLLPAFSLSIVSALAVTIVPQAWAAAGAIGLTIGIYFAMAQQRSR
jgi:Transmembrane protein 43